MKRPIDIFSKMIDEIFEDGAPTKAQIFDAFHKSVKIVERNEKDNKSQVMQYNIDLSKYDLD